MFSPFFERFQRGLLENSWETWAGSGAVTVCIFGFSYIVKLLLSVRLRKSAAAAITGLQPQPVKFKWDEATLKALERTSTLFLLALALHFGTQNLELPGKIERTRDYLFFFILFFQLGHWFTSALHFVGDSYYRSSLVKDPGRAATISTLVLLGDIGIWVLMVLLLLGNFGVNISALVAGLGVGGVAVALALQSILGDLFASLSIVLDKPFVIGDSINVNGLSGSVEHIGLKTTRIRSITGEQLIFSNSDLLKNVVRNFKRMERRRITFTFGLIYETPPALLQRARELVKLAMDEQKNVTFDRCHLSTLAASSLEFEVVYWMETSDYNAYINAHHEIMVKLLGLFTKERLEFAYPHQVSLAKTVNAYKT